MTIMKGKFIRIECDAEEPDDYYHPDNTIDGDGSTYLKIIQIIKMLGWIKYKGDWICPYCVDNNPLINLDIRRAMEKKHENKF